MGAIRLAISGTAFLVGWVFLSGTAGAQSPDPFAPCNPPTANAIVCENSKPGNPASEWDIVGAGDGSIQGFATDISVNRGELIRFKIETVATSYRLDIYRLGFYGGLGGRLIATVRPTVLLPQAQPDCLRDSTGLFDCGNWAESVSWTVPSNATSGIYVGKLVREDSVPGVSHIVFIVRDDSGGSDLLFQTSDTTWQAYNSDGNNSLYVGSPVGRAYKVSYNRPFNTRGLIPYSNSWLFDAEYPMLRWLEANGYNVSYFTGVDTDRRGAELLEHRVFLSVGHDEYWSGAQRASVEAARDAGVHLAFFSGNLMFWKTRWENSTDGSATPYRTLVSYKETHASAKIDPLPLVWTGTWRDPRFSPPADGGRPENAVTGTIFTVNCCREDAIKVPEALGKLRFWRNTTVATQSPGQTATVGSRTVGYEWDEDLDNGFRPEGLIRLSSNTMSVGSYLLDYGSTYGPGTATHSLTFYRHSSGALVFSAGTIRWAWGLDDHHDLNGASAIPAPDARMQQATVNLLADMAVQPATLQPGLVAATQSTDTVRPTSAITSPTAGSTVSMGSAVAITGTASDDGGLVAAVNVSVDDGATWHRATGTGSWSYSWVPAATGPATIRSRAVDDSGNVENPGAEITVTVGTPPPPTCPCSLWGSGVTPAVPADADSGAIELGVKFQADVSGWVTGLRFYKGATNTGPHVGRLWTSTGTLLASAPYSGETASGWQQVALPTPVAITANTTYVVSYHTTVGHYAVNAAYFATAGVSNPPLRALATGAVGGNGVFQYGAGGFPGQSFNGNNYWVDVVFTTTPPAGDTTPPTVSSFAPAAGATNVSTGANVTVTFSEPMDAATVNGTTVELRDPSSVLVPATVSYDAATRTATLDPTGALTAGVTYTARVKGGAGDPRVKDAAGNALAADVTWTFTTAAVPPPDTTPPTVTSFTPAAGAGDVSTATNVTVTFSEPMDAATVTTTTVELRDASSVLVPAAVSYNAATRTATLDPTGALTAGVTYTARVKGGTADPRVKDVAGNALAADVIWTFTTAATPPPTCPCSLWGSGVTPAVPADADSGAIELGVKFQADVSGWVTGLRFYKGATNTGPHVGRLWTSTGTLLASAPYSGETASGWQQVALPTPVAITANTTYVVSYHTTVGHYAVNAAYFATAGVSNPPLRALATGAVGGNGVFQYGAGGFPGQSFNGNNYWVDVVFTTTPPAADTTPPTVSSFAPAAGATNVSTGANVTVTFSEPMDAATVNGTTVELRDPSSVLVPATVSYDAATRTATLDPTGALTAGVTYTARVKGGAGDPRVKDAAGNALAADVTWTFTTAAVPPPDTTPPTVTSFTPAAGAGDVSTATNVTVTFNEPMDAATVTTTTVELRDASSVLVPAAVSYNAATRTATLDPTGALTAGVTYTARVKGGTADPRVKDVAGNALAADVTWTFTAGTGGLVAAYGFNEASGSTVTDASGNGHTGTIFQATWTTSGRYGSALTFDGVNDWVTVADSSLLDLTTGMTLSAWVHPTGLSGWRMVIMKERVGDEVYTLNANTGQNRPQVAIATSGGLRTVNGTTQLPLNTWTHLAGTYDGATLRLYVNGNQVASQAVTGAMLISTGALRVGGNSTWGEFFQGRIDEVRIYNRALAPTEIQTDMNTPIQ